MLGGRSGGKCDQDAKEGVLRAQSKIASGNKQLGETEVQAAWKVVYIYISICVQNTLNGIVVKTLQCWAFVWECGTSWTSYMSDSCSLSPPSGLRIKMLGLPCNQMVVSYQKVSKIIHLYPCQWNTDRSLFKKSDVMKNCARRVYSLKSIGTFSWKPDQIDLKCNFGTPRASLQQLLHYMCAYCGQIQRWGLASLWFASNIWFINMSSASFRNYSELCSRPNRTWSAWMKRPFVNIQHGPKSLLPIQTRKRAKGKSTQLHNSLRVTRSVIRELKCPVHHIKEETISSVHVIVWCSLKTIIRK